jgi:hypothetical protein
VTDPTPAVPATTEGADVDALEEASGQFVRALAELNDVVDGHDEAASTPERSDPPPDNRDPDDPTGTAFPTARPAGRFTPAMFAIRDEAAEQTVARMRAVLDRAGAEMVSRMAPLLRDGPWPADATPTPDPPALAEVAKVNWILRERCARLELSEAAAHERLARVTEDRNRAEALAQQLREELDLAERRLTARDGAVHSCSRTCAGCAR